jgi:hypothetical protein
VSGDTVMNTLLLYVMPVDLRLQPLSYCSVCTGYTKSVFVLDADRTEEGDLDVDQHVEADTTSV